LAEIGDTRPGVGVLANGTPDILWLPITEAGEVEILEGHGIRQAEPFFIASYPVTYNQYGAFVQSPDGYNNSTWWQEIPEEYYSRSQLEDQNFEVWNNPRDNISQYQSIVFSKWLNQRLQGVELTWPVNSKNSKFIIRQNAEVRLPFEWEWQLAARGGIARRDYPWGNEWKEGYANTLEAGLKRTIAVGMYPQGRAICGAYDMSGNIWEWCLNQGILSRTEMGAAARGGSYTGDSIYAGCRQRHFLAQDSICIDVGFRLVVADINSPAKP
jgi:formylglycine-generating enzyme required for sulfatase activity